MLCIVECTGSDTELPCGRYGVVRGFFNPRVFVAAGMSHFSRFWGLGRHARFLVGHKNDYSPDNGIGYCFGRFITYRQQYRKPRQVAHHRDNLFTFDPCG